MLTDIAMKGEHPGLYRLEPDRPGFARAPCAATTPRRRARPATTRASTTRRSTSCSTTPRPAIDPAKRNDLLRQANNLIYDEAPVWFFNYNKAVLAYQPWIHGLQANPTEITHQYPEDIWVDAKSPAK